MAEQKTGRRIVIPVDGSVNSERAFDWYKDGHLKHNDELLVVHAYDLYTAPPTPYPYGFAFPEDWEKHMKKNTEDARKLMQYYEKKCNENKLKCKLFNESGEPGEIICNLAKDQKADQIVMGSRGMGTVRRTLVGSVSDFCLHHSSVPVSIVPPPKQSSKLGFVNKES
ncbi:universal stress protein A-like protein [Exaiptasia diaphana]|uniref:UspA domain-containing protein n=1 Tax=Exaiptasia diaphana TaxID=2652724 RepID=A0A913Y4P8_EXADI|nr:universal stress protein A-like protein [Exaiptasia diaphana]KXJ07042.1 Universal stress protein A-like protein [Exaiptasia diaphana]